MGGGILPCDGPHHSATLNAIVRALTRWNLSRSFEVVHRALCKLSKHTERALQAAGAFSQPGAFQRRWVMAADRAVVHPWLALDYFERDWGLRHGGPPSFVRAG